jgi:prepilin-type N-terminal cleavage/methylation domain-containing protein
VCRRAFSLVELTVVLVILAVVAGAVAVSVRGPIRRVGIERAADELVAFDRLTRVYARQNDRPLRLVVDLAAGELRRTSEDGRDVLGEPLRFAPGYRPARLRLAGEDVSSGLVTLSCTPPGFTPTYAVLLEGPGGRRRWVFFAGLTGQVVGAGNDEEVEQAIALLQMRRHAD